MAALKEHMGPQTVCRRARPAAREGWGEGDGPSAGGDRGGVEGMALAWGEVDGGQTSTPSAGRDRGGGEYVSVPMKIEESEETT